MFDKKEFEDFIERLKYHHKGEGVREHGTADPVFLVQEKELIYGLEDGYADYYVWFYTSDDGDVFETDEELEERINKDFEEVGLRYDEYFLAHDHEITIDGHIAFKKIGVKEIWSTVNCHFTREAAEAFIKRKGHDYKNLRIYVDSQYWCEEWCNVVEGLITGQLTFNESVEKDIEDVEMVTNLLQDHIKNKETNSD